jgi:hypothetical protein
MVVLGVCGCGGGRGGERDRVVGDRGWWLLAGVLSWLAQISRCRLAAWQERELVLRTQSVEDLVEGGLEDG